MPIIWYTEGKSKPPAMVPKTKIAAVIEKAHLLSPEDMAKHLKSSEAKKESLEDYIVKERVIPEDVLYSAAAQFFGLPYIDLKDINIRKDVLFLVPEAIAQNHQVIAFDQQGTIVKLATTNPEDLETKDFIQKKTGLSPELYLATPSALQEAIKLYHKSLQAEFATFTGGKPNEGITAEAKKDLNELAKELPVVRVVDTLLEYAIVDGASDIHIEPNEMGVVIRYRVDGILHEAMTLPKNIQEGLIARLKILSNLKLDEHRLPQDGRFKITTSDRQISFRISFLPVFDGEKVVIRVLDEKSQIVGLEQLGFTEKQMDLVKQNMRRPHGFILVTGPTGSGKTTTLYSIINILNTSEVNISTIEDPIEYRMAGVNQSQVSAKVGFTFELGLRALMRQDPNIIMVGEIRDMETAEIAVHASLTGHLVFSTLHTNDAATALPRFIDMGVAPFLVSSTINLVLGQRLVRKLCQHCVISYNLSQEIIQKIQEQCDVPNILEMLTKEGIIDATENTLESVLFYKGKGCKQCHDSGYKGRVGIYELLEVTDAIRELIIKKESADKILIQALKDGMTTMLHNGFIKAKLGVTSIEEILRVTKE